ncbi:anthranilate synthase component I [Kwoniella mangroviensis CBS 8886]|nr:anthranilate synthase component I [Kwoniella mangroviensis CBS 8886]
MAHPSPQVVPSLDELINLFATSSSSPATLAPPSAPLFGASSTKSESQSTKPVENLKPNLIPVFVEIPADLLTPVSAYLKIAKDSKYSFLLECVIGGENLARYSFVGADPIKVIRTGEGFDVEGDPLTALEKELEPYRFVKIPQIGTFTGGAVGFITYDSIVHFEPVTKPKEPLHNPFPGMPEAFFMLSSTNLIFDHIYQTIKIVSHVHLPDGTPPSQIPALYEECVARIETLRRKLLSPEVPLPPQGPVHLGYEATSNVGKEGYEGFVTTLKDHLFKGDIIQAVPCQRFTRKTDVHPFNVYRQLRSLNPSPYMYYINCSDTQLVGASPECLCKVENRKVQCHAIAGTRRRGKDAEEDERLSKELQEDEKEKSENLQLTDLARNDVHRVCKPETVKVDRLMEIEKFSHVIHMTSQVSGMLRDDLSRFDAFRSIMPAGTLSGAPKIKAIQLIMGLEKERRGPYGGGVGVFDFDRNNLDTCICIRTMVFHGGNVHVSAGAGIVIDSVEEMEYMETIHKSKACMRAIEQAEEYYHSLQQSS